MSDSTQDVREEDRNRPDLLNVVFKSSLKEARKEISALKAERDRYRGALEKMQKSLKSNIHNFSQDTGLNLPGGAIDQDDFDAWESELKMVTEALHPKRNEQGIKQRPLTQDEKDGIGV